MSFPAVSRAEKENFNVRVWESSSSRVMIKVTCDAVSSSEGRLSEVTVPATHPVDGSGSHTRVPLA